MSVERRGQVIRVMTQLVNWQQEEPSDRGEERQLFMDDTSRVSREAQARFREGLGVQFPGATRPATGENRRPRLDVTSRYARLIVITPNAYRSNINIASQRVLGAKL